MDPGGNDVHDGEDAADDPREDAADDPREDAADGPREDAADGGGEPTTGDEPAGYEAGDRFDCPGCGDSHPVQRGAGLSVGGGRADVDRSLYVRCPVAGVVALPSGREPPAEAFEEDAGEEWP